MKKIAISVTALLFACATIKAQTIPNSGFESWSNPNGYNMPEGWDNLNGKTSSTGVYTCLKGTPGNPGTAYLKLISKNVPGMGIIPGIAVSGQLDENSFSSVSGFAFDQRPVAFTGKFQFMGASGDDIGSISVYLTRWNSNTNFRDTIGYLEMDLDGMQMSWANFNLPITYTTPDKPDSCIIILNASGKNPLPNSYLYVDNLGFSGLVSGINNLGITGSVKVYPNPAVETLMIDLSELKSSPASIEIIDFQGKTIWRQSGSISQSVSVPVNEFLTGLYMIKIQTLDGVISQKFIKQ